MVEKVPKWEAELWSCISSGNGEWCPLYDRCPVRRDGGWCVEEHREDIRQLLEGRRLDIKRCDFLQSEGKRLGRMFQLVERLACKYLKMGNAQEPPVSTGLVSLFDPQHPVEIREVPLKAYHGAIWYIEDRWIIQISGGDTSAMRRHVLFHEAFHILAHCKTTPVFRKRGVAEGYFNEELADYFAICFLMPREWVKERWAEVKDLDRMAKIFGVPKPQMFVRLRQLGVV